LEDFVYRSDGAFFAFLAEKVEQVIRDRLDSWKAQKRDPGREVPIDDVRSPGSPIPLSIWESDEGPDEVLQRREDLERLACALDQLRAQNEEYWELIVARDLDPKSFAEIAARQVKSADAVKQEFYRARAAVARIFRSLR